jgi:hypothetical protein
MSFCIQKKKKMKRRGSFFKGYIFYSDLNCIASLANILKKSSATIVFMFSVVVSSMDLLKEQPHRELVVTPGVMKLLSRVAIMDEGTAGSARDRLLALAQNLTVKAT